MKLRFLLILSTAFVFLLLTISKNIVSAAPNPVTSITICHATSSSILPYVKQTVNANGSVSGHDVHANDIIPPFDYTCSTGTCSYPGKNWDTSGQAIWNNNCRVVSATPTPTSTPTNTPTPTPTNTPTPTPTGSQNPTPTFTPTPTNTPIPTNTPTPTNIPSITPTPTGTPIGGNVCVITNVVVSDSNTGQNDSNGNTGGLTLITTGDASSKTNIKNSCNKNVITLNFGSHSNTSFQIDGNGTGSQNSLLFNSNNTLQISQ